MQEVEKFENNMGAMDVADNTKEEENHSAVAVIIKEENVSPHDPSLKNNSVTVIDDHQFEDVFNPQIVPSADLYVNEGIPSSRVPAVTPVTPAMTMNHYAQPTRVVSSSSVSAAQCDGYQNYYQQPHLPLQQPVPPPLPVTSQSSSDVLPARATGNKTKASSGNDDEEEIVKPKRPLNAYNFFFRHERARILMSTKNGEVPSLKEFSSKSVTGESLKVRREKIRYLLANNPYHTESRKRPHRKTHGKVGFSDLARHIAESWKVTDKETKALFTELAADDKKRHRKELEEYKLKKEAARYKKKLQHHQQQQEQVVTPQLGIVSAPQPGPPSFPSNQYPHQLQEQHQVPPPCEIPIISPLNLQQQQQQQACESKDAFFKTLEGALDLLDDQKIPPNPRLISPSLEAAFATDTAPPTTTTPTTTPTTQPSVPSLYTETMKTSATNDSSVMDMMNNTSAENLFKALDGALEHFEEDTGSTSNDPFSPINIRQSLSSVPPVPPPIFGLNDSGTGEDAGPNTLPQIPQQDEMTPPLSNASGDLKDFLSQLDWVGGVDSIGGGSGNIEELLNL